MNRILINLFIFNLIAVFAFGGNSKITAYVEPSSVYIGDRINLIVDVDYPDTTKIGILSMADSTMGAFNVLSVSMDSLIHQDGMFYQEIHFELAYFGITDNIIPPIGLMVIYPDSTADTLMTQPVRVNFISLVESAPPESLEIKDVKPPRKIPRNYNEDAFHILYGILIGAVIITGIWIWGLKRKGLRIIDFILPKKKPPWELALIKLDKLSKSGLLEGKEYKEYFDQLTDILREYIEGRFGVMSLELSTTETIENLFKTELDLDDIARAWFIDKTDILLHRADLVKFAKYIPDAQTGYEDWEMVEKLVVETTPKPQEEEVTNTNQNTQENDSNNKQQ